MGIWWRVACLAAGGALGTNARYWLSVWVDRRVDPSFPWATFTINVTGSFLIGLLAVVLARHAPHPQIRLLFIVGFLGGYTTFSSFTLEAVALIERAATGRALAYLAGSVASGVAAVVLGAALGRAITDSLKSPDSTSYPSSSTPASFHDTSAQFQGEVSPNSKQPSL